MAENEIAKHTKTIYKTLKNKEYNWLHKLKEITIEILIIVFAVSISIWFHNWSDELHEKKEEKAFLTGLQKDLKGDLANLKESQEFYKYVLAGTNYFIGIGSGNAIEKDSVNKYANIFFSSTDLDPHTSRYEGLKGGNKFNIIENKDLLNDIISLHESSFARVLSLNRYYHDDIDNKMMPFVSGRVQLAPNGNFMNADELLRTSQMRILLFIMKGMIKGNILPAHQDAINKCNEISKKIDGELK